MKELFSIRLSPTDKQTLRRVAAHMHLSMADALRVLMHEKADEIPVETKTIEEVGS